VLQLLQLLQHFLRNRSSKHERWHFDLQQLPQLGAAQPHDGAAAQVASQAGAAQPHDEPQDEPQPLLQQRLWWWQRLLQPLLQLLQLGAAHPQEGAASQAVAQAGAAAQVASQAGAAQDEPHDEPQDDLQQRLLWQRDLQHDVWQQLPHGFSQQLAGAAQPHPLFIPSNVSRSSNPKLWVLRLTLITSAPRIMCHFIEQPLLLHWNHRTLCSFPHSDIARHDHPTQTDWLECVCV
jgi:hypothetical protein